MSRISILSVFAVLALVPAGVPQAGTTASFRYPLSNFSGPVPSQWAKLAIDQERNEVYALNQRQNDIRIFDDHGMEIFVFGDGYSTAADIAIGRDGDIFLLSTGYQTSSIDRLDYRGDHVADVELKNLPESYSEFVADRLVYDAGRLYLVDSDALLVAVVDEHGYFEAGYDLNRALRPMLTRERAKRELDDADWKKQKLEFIELNGFTVDHEGSLLFTVPVLFTAFRVSPNGDVQTFGKAGSGPGKFGVAAGIASDEWGYVYVADRLRSVVLVFNADLEFETEFGYRGDRPSNLIVPDDLVVDREGNVYVAQAANRGVNVYKVVRGSRDLAPMNDAAATNPERSLQTIEGSEFVDMEVREK